MRIILRRDVLIPAAALCAAALILSIPYLHTSSSTAASSGAKEYKRIISLSPSLSKIAIDLGIENRIAGITSYDTAMKGKAAVIGTLISPNIEAIIALKPDAVFYCNEDSSVQNIEQLSAAGINPVAFPRIMNFNDACSALERFGELTGNTDAARTKAVLYRKEYSARTISRSKPVVLFLLSNQPLIAASGSSFIGSIIAEAGGICAAAGDMNPYPIMNKEFAARANPDIIITTAPGGIGEIRDLFSRFPQLSFMKSNSVFYLDPDQACMYDPADMRNTSRQILEIFTRWDQRQ